MKHRHAFLLLVILGAGMLTARTQTLGAQASHKQACSDGQRTAADQALTEAKTNLAKAITTLKKPSQADIARLQKWFGVPAASSKMILQGFESSLTMAAVSQIWCPVTNDLAFKWDVGDLAAVTPSEPGAVFLTPAFFKLAKTGANSQMGVLVHELTHLAGIGLKPKEVYGVAAALRLAQTEPARARINSDNYEYYVEDLVFGLK